MRKRKKLCAKKLKVFPRNLQRNKSFQERKLAKLTGRVQSIDPMARNDWKSRRAKGEREKTSEWENRVIVLADIDLGFLAVYIAKTNIPHQE